MTNRKNLFFYYRQSDAEEKHIKNLYELAREEGFTIVDKIEKANIIVSIGGDGTFLQAVRKTNFQQNCLYMGMKTSDEAGLYCDFDLNEFDELAHILRNEALEVRRFPVIDVRINDNEKIFHCLNELSIRSSIIKSFVLDVWIDDLHFEKFRGDGLIISTPTGSTGYSKSSHGAIVDPLLPCFQITELASLNNNRYRTLGSPFILSGDRKLRLEVVQDGNDYPIIGLDNEAYPIRNIRSIDISLSEKKVKTVKLKNNSFWDRVKRTFLDEAQK